MNSRKWRNPYSPLAKKAGKAAAVPAAAVPATTASLSVPAPKSLSVLDLRSSVSRMRNNIKGISSTIRQMEETMDTLYGAMQMVESLGRSSAKTGVGQQPRDGSDRGQAASEEADNQQEPATNSNPLANIDMNQLLNLLQSPLVQSLLSQHTGAAAKRKKEG
ncbi:hypothetical protein [Brevibacillus sp. SYP-B805]|uniref:hypothetical protein n=1 Tax=Brevibacillus sp. SYP-B805 TaxID=1578199 RepID=UPI001F49314C|nr:hypothetical protein [Brevibacillus sp. SYP-B805]